MYAKRGDLIDRRNRAGLTNRELAAALREPPGTTAGRLCGFAPLTPQQEGVIVSTIENRERQIKAAEMGG